MKKKIIFAFVTLTLTVASAASNRYNVKIYEPAQIAGQTLKPGDYTIELKDNRAVIKNGRQVVEVGVRVENEAKKFASSVVRYSGEAPNAKIDEIRIGGTTTRIVFTQPQAAGN